MKAARSRNIPVVNAPGRNASAVAEFTIGMILTETRLITKGHTSLAKGEWRGDLYRADLTGEELCNLTVGLIGYGHIGTKVVKLLRPFGAASHCDPYVALSAEDAAQGVECRARRLAAYLRCQPACMLGLTRPRLYRRPRVLAREGRRLLHQHARGPMVNCSVSALT
jgi:phosphoglycerate dehydrogenase-like enzyme